MNMVVAGPEAYNALLKRVQIACAEIENADAVGIAVQLGRKFRQAVFAQMVSSLPHKIEGEISPDVNVKPTAKLNGKKEADCFAEPFPLIDSTPQERE